MQEHLKLLGLRVRDKLTNLEGIVTSISFDVSGCVQGLVTQNQAGKEKWVDSHWIDTKRLMVLDEMPLVEQPRFISIPGGQDLPQFDAKPSL